MGNTKVHEAAKIANMNKYIDGGPWYTMLGLSRHIRYQHPPLAKLD